MAISAIMSKGDGAGTLNVDCAFLFICWPANKKSSSAAKRQGPVGKSQNAKGARQPKK